MRLAVVGIRGIPNNYGGFETLVEYLIEHLADEIEITVYCSSWDMKSRLREYKGAKLKYLPISSHGAFGILYDSLSLLTSIARYDKILLLGFGGGFVMPLLKAYKSKIILNIGGLDWKRNKWSKNEQKVIKKAEGLLMKNSGHLISDNIGIKTYIQDTYGKGSTFISYGGDQAQKRGITREAEEIYPFLKGKYAFAVTRIQPDNNIDMILEAFKDQDQMPIVLVGNWQNSKYGIETKAKYENEKNLILLEAIYDREKLDVLRSNCTIYIHGHSAGGTNPSLVEAMYLGLPVFSFSSGYNEYTTENEAIYFKDSPELRTLIDQSQLLDIQDIGNNLKKIAERTGRWKIVAEQYRKVIFNEC